MGVPPSPVQLPLATGLGAAIAPVTSGAGGVAGRPELELGAYEAMPLPPPATPELAPLVAGEEETCGSGRLSTRLAVAADPGWIDPVASGPLENGLSLKRDVSPLQAATPMVISANAVARDIGKRNHWTIRAIATHTHTQYEVPS